VNREQSLGWWERFGRHVLMATAYHDSVIVGARGCTFTDADGNEYLDLASGQICAIVGHNHPVLVERVVSQLTRLTHTGTSMLSPVVFEASAKVAAIAPGGLEKVLFLSTGAEANEYALRVAKACTGKTGVLALTKGYAGLTLATSSLTNYGKGARPAVPGSGYLLTPDPTECPRGRDPLDWARELLQQSLELNRGLLNNVAAIIVEPILSAGGLIVLPDGFLKELRSLADRLGALLIADEAQTGMGRTGRWFGVDHEGVVPDILVLSKGVGGGFPLSAVVTTSTIANRVQGQANQFSSHQSDPLAAAAGLAVIEIIESEGLVRQADERGEYMRQRLLEVSRRRPQLVNVRGRGLMVGFDVVRHPDRPSAETDVGKGIEDYCFERGVHLQAVQKNRFRILPPLVITVEEIDRFVAILDEALGRLTDGEAKPRKAQNEYTAAFQARQTRGVGAAVQWAWTHSPASWMHKLRGASRRAVRGRR
jgi:2,2-dialkylglycine decarboxylase (pyruvate)